MSTSDLTFSDISPDAIEQATEYLKTMLEERYPSMDLSNGRVIKKLVLDVAALLHATNREDFDRLRRSFSPLTIADDPEAADPDIVDAVYANYHVTRFTGAKAAGYVTIIIRNLVTTSVPANTVFTAEGLDYVVAKAYVGVTTVGAVITDAERLIEARDDGSYAFTVPVTAEAVGEQYRLQRDTRFTVSPAIPDVIDIVAAADFEGGLNAQTNQELVEAVQRGIAPKVYSGRAQVAALLEDTIDGIVDISQVGFGDPEMLRDRNNLFAASTGGKCDVWVQPSLTPDEIRLVKECTYVGGNIWQLSLLRDDAPGFYLVNAIGYADDSSITGSLAITSEVRGLDLTAETDWVHSVVGLVQGAYSRYQTAVIQFTDPETPDGTVVGAKVNYAVYVLRPPSLLTLHATSIDRAKRPPCGDYLVRAAVPAIAAVSLQVAKRPGTADPDETAIREAVYNRVNSLGFSIGRLPIALILDAAQGALETGGSAIISPVDMYAYIYPPDQLGRITLRDVNQLTVPDLPARGVTQRTTVFYLLRDAISISITTMPGVSV